MIYYRQRNELVRMDFMNATARLELKPMKSNSQETRMALLEQSQNHIHDALLRIEKGIWERFDKMEMRFNKVEGNFDKFDQKIDSFDKKFDLKYDTVSAKIDSNNKWLIGLAISVLFSAATLGISIYSFVHKTM